MRSGDLPRTAVSRCTRPCPSRCGRASVHVPVPAGRGAEAGRGPLRRAGEQGGPARGAARQSSAPAPPARAVRCSPRACAPACPGGLLPSLAASSPSLFSPLSLPPYTPVALLFAWFAPRGLLCVKTLPLHSVYLRR